MLPSSDSDLGALAPIRMFPSRAVQPQFKTSHSTWRTGRSASGGAARQRAILLEAANHACDTLEALLGIVPAGSGGAGAAGVVSTHDGGTANIPDLSVDDHERITLPEEVQMMPHTGGDVAMDPGLLHDPTNDDRPSSSGSGAEPPAKKRVVEKEMAIRAPADMTRASDGHTGRTTAGLGAGLERKRSARKLKETATRAERFERLRPEHLPEKDFDALVRVLANGSFDSAVDTLQLRMPGEVLSNEAAKSLRRWWDAMVRKGTKGDAGRFDSCLKGSSSLKDQCLGWSLFRKGVPHVFEDGGSKACAGCVKAHRPCLRIKFEFERRQQPKDALYLVPKAVIVLPRKLADDEDEDEDEGGGDFERFDYWETPSDTIAFGKKQELEASSNPPAVFGSMQSTVFLSSSLCDVPLSSICTMTPLLKLLRIKSPSIHALLWKFRGHSPNQPLRCWDLLSLPSPPVRRRVLLSTASCNMARCGLSFRFDGQRRPVTWLLGGEDRSGHASASILSGGVRRWKCGGERRARIAEVGD